MTRGDGGFAGEAQALGKLCIFDQTIVVFHVSPWCVVNIYACSSGSQNHSGTCVEDFSTFLGTLAAHVSGEVFAAQENRCNSWVCGSDFKGSFYAQCSFDQRNHLHGARFDAVLFFHLADVSGDGAYIVAAVNLGRHDHVRLYLDDFFQVLLPVRAVDWVDTNDHFTGVTQGGDGVSYEDSRRVLFSRCYRVFQVQNDGIGTEEVSVQQDVRAVAR